MSWTDLALLGGAIVTITMGRPIVDHLYERYKAKHPIGRADFTTTDILDRHTQYPLICFIGTEKGIKVIQPEDLTTPSDTRYLITKYKCIIDTYTMQYRTPTTYTWVSIPHTGSLHPMIIVVDEYFNVRSYDGTQSAKALKNVFPYTIDLRQIRRYMEDIKLNADFDYKVNKLYDE